MLGILSRLLRYISFGGRRAGRRNAQRLSPEERLLLQTARQSMGKIAMLWDDENIEGWVRAGGKDFISESEGATLYREVLLHLMELGLVKRESAMGYTLTRSGWRESLDGEKAGRGMGTF